MQKGREVASVDVQWPLEEVNQPPREQGQKKSFCFCQKMMA